MSTGFNFNPLGNFQQNDFVTNALSKLNLGTANYDYTTGNANLGDMAKQSVATTNTSGTTPPGGFFSDMTLDDFAKGLGIGVDTLNALIAFEGLGLAKDTFNEQKALGRTNLTNSVAAVKSNAGDINNARQRRAMASGISNPDLIDVSGFKTLGA